MKDLFFKYFTSFYDTIILLSLCIKWLWYKLNNKANPHYKTRAIYDTQKHTTIYHLELKDISSKIQNKFNNLIFFIFTSLIIWIIYKFIVAFGIINIIKLCID